MSEQQNQLTFLMVKVSGGEETIRQAVASAVQIILNDLKPATPSAPAIAAEQSAALPAPVQREISPSPGGERHAATAHSEEPAVPRARRKRRTPSAPASIAVPAQASKIPAASARGVQEKTHAGGRKLRSDATLLECSDRPGFALTIQEIASKTGHPVPTIRGWLTKAGREWFAIDHLKYRRMVPAGNGDGFYRPVDKKQPSASAGIRNPSELERDLAEDD